MAELLAEAGRRRIQEKAAPDIFFLRLRRPCFQVSNMRLVFIDRLKHLQMASHGQEGVGSAARKSSDESVVVFPPGFGGIGS